MTRSIDTQPISNADMWQELEHVVRALGQLGFDKLTVTLQGSWADAKWDEAVVAGSELLSGVKQMERAQKGQLGQDDLLIRVPELRFGFQFCNDSDLHFRFEQQSDFTKALYSRWEERGFKPTETERDNVSSPVNKLRGKQ